MTAQTIAYLKGSEFTLTGNAQRIGPSYAQDLIDTLALRTPGARVTDPEYGADPTGTSNSTAAFTAANTASNLMYVPNGIYRLDNWIPKSGTSLIGCSPQWYGETVSTTPVRPILVANATTTTNIIVVDGASGASTGNDLTIQGIMIDGTNASAASCNGISAGSWRLTLRDVTVQYCNGFGLGGAYAAGTNEAANWQTRIWNSSFLSNGNGISDQIDFWMFGGTVTSNAGDGFNFISGYSGALHLKGVRVEWNSGNGIQITNALSTPGSDANYGNKLIVSGCSFDRNYVSGIFFNGASSCLVGSSVFTRNGRNLDSNSCHVRITNSSRIKIANCISTYGNDDPNTGNISPVTWIRWSGTNSNIGITDNDMTGYNATLNSTNWSVGTKPTVGFRLVGNDGTGGAANDIDTR